MKGFFSSRRMHILLITLGLAAGVGIFYLLAAAGIGVPCLFHSLTSFQCPGCGNSRAALALLRLDLAGAMRYNALFPLEFGYLGWVYGFCCCQYLRGKPFSYTPPVPILDAVLLVVMILWGIVRNIL